MPLPIQKYAYVRIVRLQEEFCKHGMIGRVFAIDETTRQCCVMLCNGGRLVDNLWELDYKDVEVLSNEDPILECRSIPFKVRGKVIMLTPKQRLEVRGMQQVGGARGGRKIWKLKRAAAGRRGSKAKKAEGGRRGCKARKAEGGRASNQKLSKEQKVEGGRRGSKAKKAEGGRRGSKAKKAEAGRAGSKTKKGEAGRAGGLKGIRKLTKELKAKGGRQGSKAKKAEAGRVGGQSKRNAFLEKYPDAEYLDEVSRNVRCRICKDILQAKQFRNHMETMHSK